MKTSAIASLIFGTLAIAAPLEKRRYVTATEVVVQTEIVYVTVYDGQVPVAEATSTPGLFYEQPPKQSPKTSSTSTSTSTSTTSTKEEPAYTPPPAPKPTSTSSTPPPPAPEPTSVYTPPAPAPEPTSSAYVAPAPAPSSSAPAPAPAPSSPATPPSGGNEQKGEITVYDTYGGYGACGTLLSDDEFTAAISKDSWGADIWGGADNLNQNPWCGKSATVTYNGKSVTVKIMDKCQGCVPGDIDLTRAAWNKLTDNAYGSRFQGSWTS